MRQSRPKFPILRNRVVCQNPELLLTLRSLTGLVCQDVLIGSVSFLFTPLVEYRGIRFPDREKSKKSLKGPVSGSGKIEKGPISPVSGLVPVRFPDWRSNFFCRQNHLELSLSGGCQSRHQLRGTLVGRTSSLPLQSSIDHHVTAYRLGNPSPPCRVTSSNPFSSNSFFAA